MPWYLLKPFGLALLLAAVLTPLVIALARKMGWVVAPRKDRWHTKPTAVYGGVAIYLAFILGLLFAGPHSSEHWVLMACGTAMFLVGLWDDAREMRPQLKFLAQLIVAAVAVSQGIRLDNEIIPWPWISVPLAVFWLVGVTNAINILDNMDGLSSGVVVVAAGVLSVASLVHGYTDVGPITAALAGAAAGFLIYNFNPAKIFMGDCGSLFLGFTLAAVTILSANTAAGASHLIMSLVVPLGAMVVPIFDTTLVTFQRTSHGRSIAQGGRDHSSHRLVFLGLSERRAVLVLLFISASFGAVSLLLTHYADPLITGVVAALFVVLLVFFGIYLAEVKVYDASARPGSRWNSPVLGAVVLHKKQLLQIAADLVMISAAYTAAWLLRFEGGLTEWEEGLLASSLPWLLAAKLTCLWWFGLYRGEWRYVSVHDMVQIGKACLAGSALTVVLLAVFQRFELFSRSVLVIDLFLAFMFVAGARSLMRVFREKIRGQKGVPCLIMGAGDGGELLLRELRNNPSLPYVPMGFIDDDAAKRHQVIHGIKVLGNRHDIPALCSRLGIERVFISILSAPEDGFQDVFATCRQAGVECSRIQPLIKL